MNTLIWLLIYVVCIGLVFWLVWYIIDAIPIPEPINRFMKIVTIVVAVVALIFLLLKIPGAMAQDHPCDPYAPYYHKTETGPGALLADVFFFAFSAPVAVATVGGARRPVVNPHTGERRRVSTAACLPISTARHFGQTRPPHVDHWVAD